LDFLEGEEEEEEEEEESEEEEEEVVGVEDGLYCFFASTIACLYL